MLIINTFMALGFTQGEAIYLSNGWTSAVFYPEYWTSKVFTPE